MSVRHKRLQLVQQEESSIWIVEESMVDRKRDAERSIDECQIFQGQIAKNE